METAVSKESADLVWLGSCRDRPEVLVVPRCSLEPFRGP